MNKIIIGDTVGFTFSIVYENSVGKYPLPDLESSSLKFMIKKNVSDPDFKAVFVETIDNPVSNVVYFEMSSDDTSKLKPGTYKGACKMFYKDGIEKTVWSGDIIAIKGVF